MSQTEGRTGRLYFVVHLSRELAMSHSLSFQTQIHICFPGGCGATAGVHTDPDHPQQVAQ